MPIKTADTDLPASGPTRTLPEGTGAGAPPIHDADALLGGGNLALIVLGTQTYRLRLTRQGKLILNK